FSIEIARLRWILNPCCSETSVKILFQQYRDQSRHAANLPRAGTTRLTHLRHGRLPERVHDSWGRCSMADMNGTAELDLAQSQRERHSGKRDQHQHPEGIHVGQE